MKLNRRSFFARTIRTSLPAALFTAVQVGCKSGLEPDTGTRSEPAVPFVEAPKARSGEIRNITLEAAEAEVEVGAGRLYRTWVYNGSFPGPEIRVSEGETIRVLVRNRLPEGTTIHWHGLPVPNPMDGVPEVTQEPIAPGGEFIYEFVAGPAGSYMYHSHVGLQLDRGLLAPLIVEEQSPGFDYDREYLVVLDDFLPGVPQPLETFGRRGRGMGPGMMGGRGRGMGMMGIQTPPYEGVLINGRLPGAVPPFEVRRGERVRFRFMNPSGATTYRVALAGHKLAVTHTDGRPVEPAAGDYFYISMGERYDVVLEANNPGAWTLMAEPLEVQAPPARAVVRYLDSRQETAPIDELPEGIQGGREIELSSLSSKETGFGNSRRPDRTFDLTLSGGMMSSAWTINGQAYPDAEPFEIAKGELVRVNMVNHSMMIHPMHLHGHFFKVGKVLKDTVIVRPHMGRVSLEFVADNPGDWFFHCHNVYHMESGMARVFHYI